MQLEIDGQPYELPLVGSFDMDENRIFHKATGMHAEDVWLGLQDEGDLTFAALLRNEGFLPAMAHIAYRREHPEETDELIVKVVGRQKRIEMIASLASSIQGEGDAPGESEGTTSVPNESSKSSNDESASTTPSKDDSSGRPSEPSSVPPEEPRAATGTDVSDGLSTSRPLRQVV